MPHSLARFIAVSATALFGVGCGSNAPEIPDDFKTTQTGVGFGCEIGLLAENLCFFGWRNPAAVGFTGNLESICLYDFNADPNGTNGGIELLMVNTSALWCQACRQEHQTLPELASERAPSFALISLLFQDNERLPADAADLSLWTGQYDVNFPMALDPEYQMGCYAPGDTAPLNLLLDARDKMRILQKWTGNQESVIWPAVDAELAARQR